ncbi:neuronal acetylcholine receptor subunit alpha-2-like [Mizuhopecten yessoensis]|uniref:Neuronal acetylcholine receptor subunit alpha-10 n=1 Tax=Mizuhopecten yessoensis TaxID=6573 RepID=A0A210QMW4_MIZYE|nr:neuronal acetylcholine receptor subunit alpha-2-like [Mizuhopecten yessoensis]OWF50067.1 Neuronal acetylcholine receptor subunit alpha-10 [Mizuhopecten yessoensis]
MKGIKLFFVLLTIFYSHVIRYVVASGTLEDLTRLMDDVFANYSREIRPAKNLDNTVTVNTSFFLLFILDVNEVSGSISLSGGMNMLWTDYRLEWRPSDYGGIIDMMVNSSKIWTPNIFLISSSADMEKFSFQDFDARIFSSGLIVASSGKMIKSSCTVDMTRFPSDTQRCSLIILPWGYMYTEIQLAYIQPTFQMEYFNENGEWNVDSTSVERYKGFGHAVNALSFTIVLTRKSTYFIISTTVPVYIICVLNPFVFLLPASSGERISYTITMFLALAVYMTLIGDNMPKVSEPMAGISYFLLVAMLFSCLLIILTIFTLSCHAKKDVKQFPKWLRRLVFRIKKRKGKEKTYPIKPPAENASEQNVNNELEEDIKKEHFRNDLTDPEKGEVTNFIDKALFMITEITVVGLIFGFTLVYYR